MNNQLIQPKFVAYCIKNNDIESLASCLKQGFDIETSYGPDSPSLLFLAIQENQPEIVTLLLSQGADVSKIDHFGKSCLIRAIDSNQMIICQILLHYISEHYSLILDKFLVIGSEPSLLYATHRAYEYLSQGLMDNYQSQLEIIKMLIRYINILPASIKECVLNKKNAYHITALFHAASLGLVDIVSFLVSAGAAFTIRDQADDEHTNGLPLFSAIRHGHTEVVRRLLSYAKFVSDDFYYQLLNQRLMQGPTLLSAACVYGRSDIIFLLLDLGQPFYTSIAQRGLYSQVLTISCERGYNSVVELMLTQIENLSRPEQQQLLYTRNFSGHTLISLSIQHNNFALLECLLRAHFKSRITAILIDKHCAHNNALIVSCDLGLPKIAQLLLSYIKRLSSDERHMIMNHGSGVRDSVLLKSSCMTDTSMLKLLLFFEPYPGEPYTFNRNEITAIIACAYETKRSDVLLLVLQHINKYHYSAPEIFFLLQTEAPDFATRIFEIALMSKALTAIIISLNVKFFRLAGIKLIPEHLFGPMLLMSVQRGLLDNVLVILKYLEYIEKKYHSVIMNYSDPKTGHTPLLTALSNHSFEIAQHLITSSTQLHLIDKENKNNALALCVDSELNHPLLARLLGHLRTFDTNIQYIVLENKNIYGEKALDIAHRKGMNEAERLLLLAYTRSGSKIAKSARPTKSLCISAVELESIAHELATDSLSLTPLQEATAEHHAQAQTLSFRTEASPSSDPEEARPSKRARLAS